MILWLLVPLVPLVLAWFAYRQRRRWKQDVSEEWMRQNRTGDHYDGVTIKFPIDKSARGERK